MHWPEDFPIGVGVVGGLVGYKTVSAGARLSLAELCQNFKSSMLFDLYQLHDMEEIYELE